MLCLLLASLLLFSSFSPASVSFSSFFFLHFLRRRAHTPLFLPLPSSSSSSSPPPSSLRGSFGRPSPYTGAHASLPPSLPFSFSLPPSLFPSGSKHTPSACLASSPLSSQTKLTLFLILFLGKYIYILPCLLSSFSLNETIPFFPPLLIQLPQKHKQKIKNRCPHETPLFPSLLSYLPLFLPP